MNRFLLKLSTFIFFFLVGGLQSATAQGSSAKILDGKLAESGTHPWMAALLDPDADDAFNAQYCGGVLIDPYWVLTAAHCVVDRSPSGLEIGIGYSDLLGSAGVRYDVEEIIVHPDYRATRDDDLFNDIALIRLARPAEVSEFPVLSRGEADAGDTVTAFGWGALGPSGRFPRDLRQVDLRLVSRDDAQLFYGGILTDVHLAAGGGGDSGDTCSGDSGGPLIYYDNGEPIVVGLVSYGFQCGVTSSPGIYTNLLTLKSWVESTIRNSGASYLGGDSESLGGGWLVSPWLGAYNVNSYPWIYHDEIGWLYVGDDLYSDRMVGRSGIWMWDLEEGDWLWSSASEAPWFYSQGEGYLYYLFDGAPLDIFRSSRGQWTVR